MRQAKRFWLIFLLLCSALVPVSLPAQETPPLPPLPVRSYILEDFASGTVLAESNPDVRVEPASITKLMTGYLIYQAIKEGKVKLDDMVTISERAWRTGGSRMYVQVGTQVKVDDLLLGMVVQSGNDATVALAEHLAGSEAAFAEMMNREAARLGMTNSHFMNAPGLPDPNHYMSARDIATLVRAIIQDFPQDYGRYSVREFTYNKITQPNRNPLLGKDPSVDGVKTGHTQSAGYCLAASAKRDNMRLISVVLGAKTEKERFFISQTLLNYGFLNFISRTLYAAAAPLTEVPVWKGEIGYLPLGVTQPLAVALPKNNAQVELKTEMRINDAILIAPVAQGTPLGTVTVVNGEKALSEAPLVALRNVAEAGFFGRLWDSILLFFYSLFH